MPDPSFLGRLKNRKLVQWALTYLAGAFVALQALDPISEAWGISPLLLQSLQVLMVVGFFVTLVLAWYHGEKGRQRVSGSELLLLALLLVVGGGVLSALPGREEASQPVELSGFARLATLNMDRPAIAVLPLANLSADEENAYFAAGIHEELLRLLSLVRELAVISRTSVLQHDGAEKGIPEIAAELGVRYVLEGSVQVHAGRVRVQAQLIDAATDEHLWADRYDRDLGDIFALQSEVARTIAGSLEAVLAPEEEERIEVLPTSDSIAYDLYLRALSFTPSVTEEYQARVSLLQRATSRDTTFALAHSALAATFGLGFTHQVPSAFDSALARADMALRLDPNLPEAHTTRGWVLANTGHDLEGKAALQRALSISPSHARAWGHLAAMGWYSEDFVQGALAGRQGARLEPGSTSAHFLAVCLAYLGMTREANAWFRRRLEAVPGDIYALFGLSVTTLISGDSAGSRLLIPRMRVAGADNPMVLAYSGLLHILMGDADAAAEVLGAIDPEALDASTNNYPTAGALLGWAEVRTGRPGGRERLQALQSRRLEQVAAAQAGLWVINDLSVIASVLGGEEAQLHWFREAIRMGEIKNYHLRDAPWYDGIRDQGAFQAWVRKIGALLVEHQRELASLGPWMPEEVLGAGVGS
jgi:TolB-like protein/Flp pilus assembly protein TadD